MKYKLPEILVFAGPNGSGKSTINSYIKSKGKYINADDIKMSTGFSDLKAAKFAESLREDCLNKKEDFTFETVLSTERNLNLLRKAKDFGYFIRCIYVLTNDPFVNILRVSGRFENGGHSVPKEKIISRYYKSINFIPELIDLCDIMHIYDNTDIPFRIFKKKKNDIFIFSNDFWENEQIKLLCNIK